MSGSAFDPTAFKTTTRQQWQTAAEAWDRWNPTLDAWLGPVTDRMLDLCGVVPGANVLDVAAGAGGQSVAAARRVGPGGNVLATDISPAILAYAKQRALALGLDNLTVHEADGEDLGVPARHFDAVISRLGLMYFPDQPAALAGMRAALRPGGRIGAIVYSPADRNGFFSVPVAIIRRHAELPEPASDARHRRHEIAIGGTPTIYDPSSGIAPPISTTLCGSSATGSPERTAQTTALIAYETRSGASRGT